MIYYPLSVLMLAGIREILIISTPAHLPLFKSLLGSGVKFGVNFEYIVQEKPQGLAQAFLLAEDFIDGESSCLVLGDNLFYGHGMIKLLRQSAQMEQGATVFAYEVVNPSDYGVVAFDKTGLAYSLEEKPEKPLSNFAVPGLYFYDEQVCSLARSIKPSARGELEITDLNRLYLAKGQLRVEQFGRGVAWLDTGTHETLHAASSFVGVIQNRTGLKVSCPEEIAYSQKWISHQQLLKSAEELGNNEYGQYLKRLLSADSKEK